GPACARRGLAECLDGLVVAMRRGQRLGVLELCLDLGPLLRRDPGGEERWIDAELLGKPGDRRRRGARLAALDLTDVLLRKALAGELRLREPGRDAERES